MYKEIINQYCPNCKRNYLSISYNDYAKNYEITKHEYCLLCTYQTLNDKLIYEGLTNEDYLKEKERSWAEYLVRQKLHIDFINLLKNKLVKQ